MPKFVFANEIPGWDKMTDEERIKAKYENRDEILYLRADSTLMQRAEDEYAALIQQEEEAARTNPQIQRDLIMQQMEEAAKSGEITRFRELASQYKQLGSASSVIETTVEDVQQILKEQGERNARQQASQLENMKREAEEHGYQFNPEAAGLNTFTREDFGNIPSQENTNAPADIYDANGHIDMNKYSEWRKTRSSTFDDGNDAKPSVEHMNAGH